MVHVYGVIADTRISSSWTPLHVNAGVAKSTNREALTEYMIALADVQAA